MASTRIVSSCFCFLFYLLLVTKFVTADSSTMAATSATTVAAEAGLDTCSSSDAQSSQCNVSASTSTSFVDRQKQLHALQSIPYQVAEEPRIYVIDNVFSKEECDKLIKAGKHMLTKAEVMDPQGKKASNDINKRKPRDSSTTGLHPHDDPVVTIFRERMANLALMPEENGEILQLTRYGVGQYYDPHFDSSLKVGRLATVLVFLNDVEEGGYLAFPWAKMAKHVEERNVEGVYGTGRNVKELKGATSAPTADKVCTLESNSLLIKPKMGRVALFFTHKPDLKRESYRAMHCGCPVIKGEKFVAQLWIDWFGPGERNEFNELVTRAKESGWQAELIPEEK